MQSTMVEQPTQRNVPVWPVERTGSFDLCSPAARGLVRPGRSRTQEARTCVHHCAEILQFPIEGTLSKGVYTDQTVASEDSVLICPVIFTIVYTAILTYTLSRGYLVSAGVGRYRARRVRVPLQQARERGFETFFRRTSARARKARLKAGSAG